MERSVEVSVARRRRFSMGALGSRGATVPGGANSGTGSLRTVGKDLEPADDAEAPVVRDLPCRRRGL